MPRHNQQQWGSVVVLLLSLLLLSLLLLLAACASVKQAVTESCRASASPVALSVPATRSAAVATSTAFVAAAAATGAWRPGPVSHCAL